MKSIFITLTSLFIIFTSAQVFAENKKRRGPPPEAFVACEDKLEGDTVSIKTPHGDTVDAICKLMKAKLVAVPEKRPARHSETRN